MVLKRILHGKFNLHTSKTVCSTDFFFPTIAVESEFRNQTNRNEKSCAVLLGFRVVNVDICGDGVTYSELKTHTKRTKLGENYYQISGNEGKH